jgi:uroporphyrinogen III methyltransferase/synthase
MTGGVVYLVGAGPGDPGLLTVRAAELLARCDAVVFDALTNPAILALASDRDSPPTLHDVGKRGGSSESARQGDIDALLIALANDGKRVVRLKGGDPFVFGRGGEEARALAAAGVRFEVVPGVTAGIAAPAYAGIPVTHRGLATSVTFVTGHEDPEKSTASTDWSALAKTGGTIVLYMGVKTLPTIVRSLVRAGMSGDTPAAAVQWGTLPRQRSVVATLDTLVHAIAREGITAPVITVIGDVVSLRDEIAWFEHRPLYGKRIVVTRARSRAASLSARLAAAGAEVIEMPATRVQPLDSAPLRRAVERMRDYAWAIFTSQNAVDVFWGVLRAASLDARALAGVRVAAVGPSTAASLRARGIEVDVSPERFVAEGLIDEMRARDDVGGRRVLYACAEGARDVLPAALREMGAVVDLVFAYRSVADGEGAAALRARLEAGDVDLVTFTSASAVTAFAAAVGRDAARAAPSAVIGPVTASAARALGIDVVIEAAEATVQGLADAIAASPYSSIS